MIEKLLTQPGEYNDCLKSQISALTVMNRKMNTAGFLVVLGLLKTVHACKMPRVFRIGNVVAQVDGLESGLGFLLLIKDGFIHSLEGYSFGESVSSFDSPFVLEYSDVFR